MRAFKSKIFNFILAVIMLFSWVVTPVGGYAQVLNLPPVGTLLKTSNLINPVLLRGVKVDPSDPFSFDFIVDKGDLAVAGESLLVAGQDGNLATNNKQLATSAKEFQSQSTELIKYFLTALTIPGDQMWVNLSPQEEDRIIESGFGQTEMGRDMLAQDYLLKQLVASITHPDTNAGHQFYSRLYEKMYHKYGHLNLPVDTFHKVWIMPDYADVFETDEGAFVTEARLKVMMEKDYRDTQYEVRGTINEQREHQDRITYDVARNTNESTSISTDLMKEIIIPELEFEINNGQMFAQVRQIYHSLVLATWYKQKLKGALLNQVYANQGKTDGVTHNTPNIDKDIWKQYVKSFETGVYNFIKEQYDPSADEIIPRKYFSGGLDWAQAAESMNTSRNVGRINNFDEAKLVTLNTKLQTSDQAMSATDTKLEVSPKEKEDPIVKLTRGIKNGEEKAINHLRKLKNDNWFIDVLRYTKHYADDLPEKLELALAYDMAIDDPADWILPSLLNEQEVPIGVRIKSMDYLLRLRNVKGSMDFATEEFQRLIDEIFNSMFLADTSETDLIAIFNIVSDWNRSSFVGFSVEETKKVQSLSKTLGSQEFGVGDVFKEWLRTHKTLDQEGLSLGFFRFLRNMFGYYHTQNFLTKAILDARINAEVRHDLVDRMLEQADENLVFDEFEDAKGWIKSVLDLYQDRSSYKRAVKLLDEQASLDEIMTFLSHLPTQDHPLGYLLLRFSTHNSSFIGEVIQNKSVDVQLRLFASALSARKYQIVERLDSQDVKNFIKRIRDTPVQQFKASFEHPLGEEELRTINLAVLYAMQEPTLIRHFSENGLQEQVSREDLDSFVIKAAKSKLLRSYDNANSAHNYGLVYIRNTVESSEEFLMTVAHETGHGILKDIDGYFHNNILERRSIHEYFSDLMGLSFAEEFSLDRNIFFQGVDKKIGEMTKDDEHAAARIQFYMMYQYTLDKQANRVGTLWRDITLKAHAALREDISFNDFVQASVAHQPALQNVVKSLIFNNDNGTFDFAVKAGESDPLAELFNKDQSMETKISVDHFLLLMNSSGTDVQKIIDRVFSQDSEEVDETNWIVPQLLVNSEIPLDLRVTLLEEFLGFREKQGKKDLFTDNVQRFIVEVFDQMFNLENSPGISKDILNFMINYRGSKLAHLTGSEKVLINNKLSELTANEFISDKFSGWLEDLITIDREQLSIVDLAMISLSDLKKQIREQNVEAIAQIEDESFYQQLMGDNIYRGDIEYIAQALFSYDQLESRKNPQLTSSILINNSIDLSIRLELVRNLISIRGEGDDYQTASVKSLINESFDSVYRQDNSEILSFIYDVNNSDERHRFTEDERALIRVRVSQLRSEALNSTSHSALDWLKGRSSISENNLSYNFLRFLDSIYGANESILFLKDVVTNSQINLSVVHELLDSILEFVDKYQELKMIDLSKSWLEVVLSPFKYERGGIYDPVLEQIQESNPTTKTIEVLESLPFDQYQIGFILIRHFSLDANFLSQVAENQSINMHIRLSAAGLLARKHDQFVDIPQDKVRQFMREFANILRKKELTNQSMQTIFRFRLAKEDLRVLNIAVTYGMMSSSLKEHFVSASSIRDDISEGTKVAFIKDAAKSMLSRSDYNADSRHKYGIKFIQKIGTGSNFLMLLAHEIAHNILITINGFYLKTFEKRAIHEYFSDLMALAFAEEFGLSNAEYVEDFFEIDSRYFFLNQDSSRKDEHVPSRLQINQIVFNSLNGNWNPSDDFWRGIAEMAHYFISVNGSFNEVVKLSMEHESERVSWEHFTDFSFDENSKTFSLEDRAMITMQQEGDEFILREDGEVVHRYPMLDVTLGEIVDAGSLLRGDLFEVPAEKHVNFGIRKITLSDGTQALGILPNGASESATKELLDIVQLLKRKNSTAESLYPKILGVYQTAKGNYEFATEKFIRELPDSSFKLTQVTTSISMEEVFTKGIEQYPSWQPSASLRFEIDPDAIIKVPAMRLPKSVEGNFSNEEIKNEWMSSFWYYILDEGLKNSVKAFVRFPTQILVRARLDSTKKNVVVDLIDNGKGIPKKILSGQIKTTRVNPNEGGQGLDMMREYTQHLGGEMIINPIDVKSPFEEGTTIRFSFPVIFDQAMASQSSVISDQRLDDDLEGGINFDPSNLTLNILSSAGVCEDNDLSFPRRRESLEIPDQVRDDIAFLTPSQCTGFTFSAEQIEKLKQSIDGFVPVIINMQPVINLPLLLGYKEEKEEVSS